MAGRTQPFPLGARIDVSTTVASSPGCWSGRASVAASQGNNRSLPGNATGMMSRPRRSTGSGPISIAPPAGTALPLIRTGRGTGGAVVVRPAGIVNTAVPSPTNRRCCGVRAESCIADHSSMPRFGAVSSKLFSAAFGTQERYISTWNQTGQV
ncbi:hypothetical protein ACFQ0O_28040 [Saccharopolyspora spinosporotrichia]